MQRAASLRHLHSGAARRGPVTAQLIYLPALLAIAIALSSCGQADVKNRSSQIAAKVNGDEISVHQINSVIAHSNSVAPDQAKQAAAQVLERIIDEELLVQRALKAKLDRDPQVMQAIESAKRQILARAYIERASAASTESPEEMSKFYKENPALFERRRIYHVHELVVAAPQEKLVALQTATAGAKSLNDVAAWLKSHGLPFNVATSARGAEQVPLDILPQMSAMKEGQIAVITTSRGTSVVQLLRAEEAPLSELEAGPIIRQFLANLKRIELARTEIGRLREQGKIEYVGEFAASAPAAPARPAAAGAPLNGGTEQYEHIKRGVAGLR